MKKNTAILFSVIVIFIFVLTISSSEESLFDFDILRYSSSAEVAAPVAANETLTIGFDIDTTNLNFGVIPGNGSFSKRFINMTNEIDKFVKISLEARGKIAPYVNFSMNDFFLKGNERAVIIAYFYTTGAEAGNYSGEIVVTIKKPKYDFVYLFWGPHDE